MSEDFLYIKKSYNKKKSKCSTVTMVQEILQTNNNTIKLFIVMYMLMFLMHF